jgi:hypothetical protein
LHEFTAKLKHAPQITSTCRWQYHPAFKVVDDRSKVRTSTIPDFVFTLTLSFPLPARLHGSWPG